MRNLVDANVSANNAVKILRTFPNPSDEAELVGELVKGWCPFEGASDDVWASMGSDAEEIRTTTGSALEVSFATSRSDPS